MRLRQTKIFTFLRMESWFFEPAFVSLGIEKGYDKASRWLQAYYR